MTSPDPGTDEAIEAGCKCPVMDNHRGAGYMGRPGVFIYSMNCPIHIEDVTKLLESGK